MRSSAASTAPRPGTTPGAATRSSGSPSPRPSRRTSTSRPTPRPAQGAPAGSLTGMEAGAGAQTAPTPTAAVPAQRSAAMTVVRDYLTLTKPKVQSLLLFTTVTTMSAAGEPSLGLILLTCFGGALSAGGAGAINHAIDRDIDITMARTADRPVASGRVSPAAAIPRATAPDTHFTWAPPADRPVASGRVSPAAAIAFGTFLGAASFALLAL